MPHKITEIFNAMNSITGGEVAEVLKRATSMQPLEIKLSGGLFGNEVRGTAGA